MKKILLSAAVMTLCIGGAFAQDKTTTHTPPPHNVHLQSRRMIMRERMAKMPPAEVARIKTARLDRTVKLTPEQRKKITNIYLNEAKENKKHMAARQKFQNEVNAVLTKDQIISLGKAEKMRMQKMRARSMRKPISVD